MVGDGGGSTPDFFVLPRLTVPLGLLLEMDISRRKTKENVFSKHNMDAHPYFTLSNYTRRTKLTEVSGYPIYSYFRG